MFLLLLSLLVGACGAEPTPTEPPDATTEVTRGDVLCPTENEQARQFYNDAVIHEVQGQLGEAEGLYLKAIELDPGFCDAMDNLGLLLRSQGLVEEAISWYMRSIEILPDNPVAHQNLAFAYSILGRTEEAVAEYNLLIEIDPENPEGYYGLGNIHLDLGQPQQAVTQFAKAEQLYMAQESPLVADARLALGVSHYMLERCSDAKEYLEMVYSEGGDHANVNYLLGLCYLCPEIEDLELADEYVTKAQELGMEIPEEVQQRLGW